jgi:hypothetical protein
MEMDHEKQVMGRQLDRCLVMVMAVSGEASVPTKVPMMVLTMGSPPPSSGLTQEALIRWVNGASLGDNGG